MKLTLRKTPIFPIAFSLLLLLALTSCQKESLEPAGVDDTRLEELAGRFSSEMDSTEFVELYDLVLAKTREELAARPAPQADISNRCYDITYSNLVRIEVGGVVYIEELDQVSGGSTVNGVYLPPELFAQLDAAAPHEINLRIRDPFNIGQLIFGLRQAIITVKDQGNKVYYGLYNVNTHEYLFLGVTGSSGNVGNTACGAIGMGRVSGRVASPYTQLTNGEVAYGFIAGCGPVLIGASITFFYTGAESL